LDTPSIHSAQTEAIRGYRKDAFEDAFSGYLPSKASERQELNKTWPESPVSMCQAPTTPDALKTAEQADFHWVADGMTHRTPDPGDGGNERF
jgi:hypothetical protein